MTTSINLSERVCGFILNSKTATTEISKKVYNVRYGENEDGETIVCLVFPSGRPRMKVIKYLKDVKGHVPGQIMGKSKKQTIIPFTTEEWEKLKQGGIITKETRFGKLKHISLNLDSLLQVSEKFEDWQIQSLKETDIKI